MAMPGAPRRRAWLALAAAAAILAGAAAAALLAARQRPLGVGFYDVDGPLRAALSRTVDSWAQASGTKTRYSTLDSLDASLRGIDAVFLYPSGASAATAGNFAGLAPALTDRVSLTLRRAAEAGGRYWCLPILADTAELDWRKDAFAASPAPGSFSIGALAAAARAAKGKADAPLVLSGGDDSALLDAAGLLVLEKGGIGAYGRLAAASRSMEAPGAIAADLGGFDLRSALEPLAALRNERLLHPNWLDFKRADSRTFQAERLAALSLQSLSARRSVPYDALASWGSSVLLAGGGSGQPVVVASTPSIARPASSRAAKSFESLAEYLSSPKGQDALQAATGLAPASASARAADVQASEARFAASGSVVVQGLSRDGFGSDRARAGFAAELRRYLISRIR
jgi:ABC-type glycerol-3-phosphate transport system substrate-binding protein